MPLSAGSAASSRSAAADGAYELPTVDPGRALVPDHRAMRELLDDEDVERALRGRAHQHTALVSSSDVLQRICAALDPVLVPHGFASGQAGASAGSAQVIWCAGYDDAARHPQLPPSGDQEPGRGACVDVVLTAHDDGSGWRLTGVALEGHGLASCLRAAGDEGAARADALPGTPLQAALDVLPSLLDGVLRCPGEPE